MQTRSRQDYSAVGFAANTRSRHRRRPPTPSSSDEYEEQSLDDGSEFENGPSQRPMIVTQQRPLRRIPEAPASFQSSQSRPRLGAYSKATMYRPSPSTSPRTRMGGEMTSGYGSPGGEIRQRAVLGAETPTKTKTRSRKRQEEWEDIESTPSSGNRHTDAGRTPRTRTRRASRDSIGETINSPEPATPRRQRQPPKLRNINKILKESFKREFMDDSSSYPSPAPSPPPNPGKDSTLSSLLDMVLTPLEYTLNILWNIFSLFRKPLYILIALYISALVLFFGGRYLVYTLFSGLSPLCLAPGFSSLGFCTLAGQYKPTPSIPTFSHFIKSVFDPSPPEPPVDFTTLIELQRPITTMLESSATSTIMGMELKLAEHAVRSLRVMVAHSSLTCRPMLAKLFDQFINNSEEVFSELTRFEPKVETLADLIILTNQFSIKGLEEAKRIADKAEAEDQTWTGRLLRPFKATQTADLVKRRVMREFVQASATIESNLERIINHAIVILKGLDQLDDHLHTITKLIHEEDARVTAAAEEVLAEIWTMVGGNRQKIHKLAKKKTLLQNLVLYRGRAVEGVAGTLVVAKGMLAKLKSLQDQVEETAQSATLPEDGEQQQQTMHMIPLEVQIEAIRLAASRLTDTRNELEQRSKDAKNRLIDFMNNDKLDAMEEIRQTWIDSGGASYPATLLGKEFNGKAALWWSNKGRQEAEKMAGGTGGEGRGKLEAKRRE